MKSPLIRHNFISLSGYILNTFTLIIKIFDGKWLPVHWTKKYLEGVTRTGAESTLSNADMLPDFWLILNIMKSVSLKDRETGRSFHSASYLRNQGKSMRIPKCRPCISQQQEYGIVYLRGIGKPILFPARLIPCLILLLL